MMGEGEGVSGSRAEALQIALGCTEHLAKPIQTKEFFAVLQRYLGEGPAGSKKT